MSAGIVRVGISGWTFAEWRGVFYPKGLRREHELCYAAGHFPALEINDTFHGPQRRATYANWAGQVPPYHLFAVRGPRSVTHVNRLREVEAPLARFFASGVLSLGVHLGPLLWQLPANLRFDAARLDAFLGGLPRDTSSAARLGMRHDGAPRFSPALEVEAPRPLRHALEVRHASFRNPAFITLLRRHEIALVCSDAADWPNLLDITADFVYCRLHGACPIGAGGYGGAALEMWADRIRHWSRGGSVPPALRVAAAALRRRRDVFVFFDSAMRVAAPLTAQELMRRLRT